MKNLLLASALVAFSSTAAFAECGPLSSIKPDASLEYALEAKKWSGDVGVTASVLAFQLDQLLIGHIQVEMQLQLTGSA